MGFCHARCSSFAKQEHLFSRKFKTHAVSGQVSDFGLSVGCLVTLHINWVAIMSRVGHIAVGLTRIRIDGCRIIWIWIFEDSDLWLSGYLQSNLWGFGFMVVGLFKFGIFAWSQPGLPDFLDTWYPNRNKCTKLTQMYRMVIKNLLSVKYSKWP
jgi:hypothetical protein